MAYAGCGDEYARPRQAALAQLMIEGNNKPSITQAGFETGEKLPPNGDIVNKTEPPKCPASLSQGFILFIGQGREGLLTTANLSEGSFDLAQAFLTNPGLLDSA